MTPQAFVTELWAVLKAQVFLRIQYRSYRARRNALNPILNWIMDTMRVNSLRVWGKEIGNKFVPVQNPSQADIDAGLVHEGIIYRTQVRGHWVSAHPRMVMKSCFQERKATRRNCNKFNWGF